MLSIKDREWRACRCDEETLGKPNPSLGSERRCLSQSTPRSPERPICEERRLRQLRAQPSLPRPVSTPHGQRDGAAWASGGPGPAGPALVGWRFLRRRCLGRSWCKSVQVSTDEFEKEIKPWQSCFVLERNCTPGSEAGTEGARRALGSGRGWGGQFRARAEEVLHQKWKLTVNAK